MSSDELIEIINEYYASGKFAELEAFLLDCLNRQGYSAPQYQILILNELGTYYRGATRFEEAIFYFRKTINILADTTGSRSIEYATAVNNLGGAYRMAGQYDKARECFIEMTDIYAMYQNQDPMLYASGINNLALLDLATKQYDSALCGLQKALSIISEYPQYQWEQATTLCNMGICLLRTGKPDRAESLLMQAKDMISSMPESRQGHLGAVFSALGEVYLMRKQKEKALTAFKTARAFILKHYGRNRDYENVCSMIERL